MPEEWTPAEIVDFSGGMRRDKSPIELRDNEVRLARNCVLDERGAVAKRAGYAKLRSAAIAADVVSVDNIFRFNTTGGNYTVISCFTTTYNKIYYDNGTTYTEITGGTALSAGEHVEFMAYGDYLLIANGSQFQYWTGSGAKADCGYKAGSVSVVPKVMAISDNRLFAVTNTSGQRFTVFFTAEGVYDTDPTDINFVSNYDFDVPNKPGDGNGMNALWQYGNDDELLTFMDIDMHYLGGVDNTDYALQQVSRIAGCVSPTGICETPEGLVVFVGNENIYAFDGARITPIGNAIKPLIDGFNLSDACCEYVPKIGSVVIGYKGGTIVWHVASGLKGNFSTQQYWDIGGWSEWTFSIAAMARYDASGDSNQVVFALKDTPYIYVMNSGTTDDSADIEFRVQTKSYTLGPFMQTKECKEAWVVCKTESTTPCSVTVTRLCAHDGPKNSDVVARCNQTGPLLDVEYLDQFLLADDQDAIAIADISGGMTGNIFSADVHVEDSNDLTVYGIGLRMKVKERN